MIEYGLSVSVNTTPRTPQTHRGERTPRTPPSFEMCQDESILHAPRKPSFASVMRETEVGGGGGQEMVMEISDSEILSSGSSARALFVQNDSGGNLRRHLNFEQEDISSSLSPISFRTNSVKACAPEESIGECGVCYSDLPLRANHVFTICGHLFCLRCLLTWWDSATTCPICRAELFDDEAEAEAEAEAAAAAAAEDDNDMAELANGSDEDNEMNEDTNEVLSSNNEERWMRREFWNGRVDILFETDDESYENYEEEDDNNDDEPNTPTAPVGGGAGMSVRWTHVPIIVNNNGVTRFNRYLHQDIQFGWSLDTPEFHDTALEQISRQEIEGLRENRDIAMTLFARMRFRETLFQSGRQFMGRVWDGVFVHKNEWTSINPCSHDSAVMYEFVIRHDSEISPLFEVNIFGFIRDVVVRQIGGGGGGERADADGADDGNWEELHEYVFVADVFTPTDFYINGDWGNTAAAANTVRSYGGYNIEEGTLTTQELVIPFSQIRRLYLIAGDERLDE